jgi:hypothetical protein
MCRYVCVLTIVAFAQWRAPSCAAEEARLYEEGGVTFRETVRTVRRPVVQTEWQQREQTVYRQQLSTQTRETLRTYTTPVTQHEWITRLHGRWNPFVAPYFTHHLVPVTRWETRAEVVGVPVVQSEWVPEKRVVSVPVTTHRMAEEKIVTRVPIGQSTAQAPPARAAALPRQAAYEAFGVALQSDPPRQGWRPRESVTR